MACDTFHCRIAEGIFGVGGTLVSRPSFNRRELSSVCHPGPRGLRGKTQGLEPHILGIVRYDRRRH
jgi:hypothetical protein